MRTLWRLFVVGLTLLILWSWLDADDHVAAHKATIERHRIEQSKGEQPRFFLNRTRRVDAWSLI